MSDEIRIGKDGQFIINDTFKKLKLKEQSEGLFGEFGVPVLYPGASINEKADRYRQVVAGRICCQFTNLRRDDEGRIYATVTPYGPQKKIIKKTLEKGMHNRLKFEARIVSSAGNLTDLITYDLISF